MPGPDGQLTKAELAQLVALINAQAAAREQVTRTAVNGTRSRLRTFRGWWRPGEVAALIAEIRRLVQPSQRRMARLTDAYLARSTSVILGRRVGPVGLIDITALRRVLSPLTEQVLAAALTASLGADPALPAGQADRATGDGARADTRPLDPGVPYERLASFYRYQIAEGQPDTVALQTVLQRAAMVVDTDISLAHRAQAHRFMRVRQVRGGYRRVLRPELGSGGPPCGICVVAADRVYSYEQLQPIHPGCRCGVIAVGDTADPGFSINADDLAAIYAAAGGNTREALRQIRVQVTEHGELGPILINADQHFRSPRDVARTTRRDAAPADADRVAA
ncbi:hypothetical protein [Actinoplanes sp. NPDC049118]|uniref:hypothetical protein n=1 Tax=Actinoplanes sp. NPDC049118 TaxID=3155769 RepID=UPI0033CDC7DD